MCTSFIVLRVAIIFMFGFMAVGTVRSPLRYQDIYKSAGYLGDVALSDTDARELQLLQSRISKSSSSLERKPPNMAGFVAEVMKLKESIKRSRKQMCKHGDKHKCRAERKLVKAGNSRRYEYKMKPNNSKRIEVNNAKRRITRTRTRDDAKGTRSPRLIHPRTKRAAIANHLRLWPNGVIPYSIETGVYKWNTLLTIRSAMKHWESKTCIVFKEREPMDVNYINITKTPCGCCADVGMIGTGPQILSLNDGCLRKGIIIHELGHTIGFYHEHNRPDRDKYIQVHNKNIKAGAKYAFTIKDRQVINSLGEPYDYNSIMHYSRNKFSKLPVLDTLVPKRQPGMLFRPSLGPRHSLSPGDIAQTKTLYECTSCGQTLHDLQGSFSHNPTPGKGETCQWRITVTLGGTVELTISDLDIIQSAGCTKAYLEVRDGPTSEYPVLGRLCGQHNSVTIRSSSERVWVEFKSTGEVSGFSAVYKGACIGYVSKDKGLIASPGWPEVNYPANMNCTWILHAEEDSTIHITFDDFYLESRIVCKDYVEMRNGVNAQAPLIGRYCSRTIPPDVHSNGTDLFIRFISNKRIQTIGFLFSYIIDKDECKYSNGQCEQVCENTIGSYLCSCYLNFELHSDGKRCNPKCGGYFTQGSGSITSPSFPDLYPPDKTCEWQFIALNNHKIFLDFEHFDLEGDGFMECTHDYLRIGSGEGKQAESIGKFCGFISPPPIVSESNTLRLELISDKTVQKTGFNITFIFDDDECAVDNGACDHGCENTIGSVKCTCNPSYTLQNDGRTCIQADSCSYLITGGKGKFHSPDYPKKYPNRMDCTWHIQTVLGHKVKVTFRSFVTEEHSFCRYDHLEVYDGANDAAPRIGKFCGTKVPKPVISSGQDIFFYFFSDASERRKGFDIRYDSVCGGTIQVTGRVQTLLSHGLYGKKNYKNRENCKWILNADPGNVIEMLFDDFHVEMEDKCSFDAVTIYDGREETDPVLGLFCGSRVPDSIVSSSESLLIHFRSDDTLGDSGFSVGFQQMMP